MQEIPDKWKDLSDEEILNWLEFFQECSLFFIERITKTANEIKFLEELYGRDFNK